MSAAAAGAAGAAGAAAAGAPAAGAPAPRRARARRPREAAARAMCNFVGENSVAWLSAEEQEEASKQKREAAATAGDGGGRNGAEKKTGRVVLMRHGESMFNELNLFTGDADIPLSEKGVIEALAGGRAFDTVDFDIIVCSRLNRSRQTAMLALTQSKTGSVPIHVRGGIGGVRKEGDDNRRQLRETAIEAMDKASCPLLPLYSEPALNERSYGSLQGMNKADAVNLYGAHQVNVWRRSSSVRPPGGESMVDTAERAVGFFVREIEPRLAMGQNILISAHGNSLRTIIAHIMKLTEEEALRLNVVTAQPYMFTYDSQSTDDKPAGFLLESELSSCSWPPKTSDQLVWAADREWAHGPTSRWVAPEAGKKSADVDVLNGF